MAKHVFAASFGGKNLQDPKAARKQMIDQRLDASLFWGKANAYRCAIGPEPGEAWLLMMRRDLDEMDLYEDHELVMEYSDGSDEPTALSVYLTVESAVCMTPGKVDDPDSLYLLRATDMRSRMQRYITPQMAFNVRDPSQPSEFFEWSKKPDGPDPDPDDDVAERPAWTWQQAIQKIFSDGLRSGAASVGEGSTANGAWYGSSDRLPVLSGGESEWPDEWMETGPENFFVLREGVCASLQRLLDLCGAWLIFDPVINQFRVARAGAADGDFDTLIADNHSRVLWRDNMLDPQRPRIPYLFLVEFPVALTSRTESDQLQFPTWTYGVRLTDPINPDGGESFADHFETEDHPLLSNDQRSTMVIRDTMSLIASVEADDGSPVLHADSQHLSDFIRHRARDRVFAMLEYLAGPDPEKTGRRVVYSGIIPTMIPGTQVEAVRWGDTGEGPFTEIMRTPSRHRPQIYAAPAVGGGNRCRAQNERQQIIILGRPNGGSIDVQIRNASNAELCSATIPFDAVASAVAELLRQARVDVLTAANPDFDGDTYESGFRVTGGPLPDAAIEIEFVSEFAQRPMGVVVVDWTLLTGGVGVGVIVTRSAEGRG
jgi:hypothetical protein